MQPNKNPVDFDFGDDLSRFDSQQPQPSTDDDIRRSAHVANGGEIVQHDCPRCRGTGVWRGYSRTFSCNGCNGTGKVSQGRASAFKGMQTKKKNQEAWQDAHADLIGQLRAIAGWNTFAQSLLSDLEAYGTLKDWKVEKAQKMLATIGAKREEKKQERQTTRGGAVDVSRIEQLFGVARSNGLKRLKFRTEHIEISVAKETSRNAGALYVTHDGTYAGKIVDGKFIAGFDAKPDTLQLVCEVAEDPTGRAKQYGIKTGNCSCCGRELTDPHSIAAGIGPICAEGWGL